MTSGGFEDVKRETKKWVICSGKTRVYGNGKVKITAYGSLGFVQMWLNKATTTMKGGAFVMSLVHAFMLKFGAVFRKWLT